MDRVTVQRVQVVGVALWAATQRGPLGQQRDEPVDVVEFGGHADQCVAGPQQLPHGVTQVDVPDVTDGEVVRDLAQPCRGVTVQHVVTGDQRPDHPRGHTLVERLDVVGQLDRAVHDREPRSLLLGRRSPPAPGAGHGTGDAAPGAVVGVLDRPGREEVPGQRTVRRGVVLGGPVDLTDALGDLLLVLEAQDVHGRAAGEVERHAQREQLVLGGAQPFGVRRADVALGRERLERRFPGQRGSDPAQRLHVAQPASPVLDVGFELLGRIPGLLPALLVGVGEQLDPASTTGELVEQRHAACLEPFGVTGHDPAVQQRRRRVELLERVADQLLGRADRVSELQARIPERVEDGAGDRIEVRRLETVVQDEEVDVRARAQLHPPVTADGDDGDGPAARCRLPERLDRVVDLRGPGVAPRAAGWWPVLGQPLPGGAQARDHRRHGDSGGRVGRILDSHRCGGAVAVRSPRCPRRRCGCARRGRRW